jgi:hypothetical protein
MQVSKEVDGEATESRALYLVSCVGRKQPTARQAKDLYASDWFCKARTFVEASGHPWFILSAKFGLVAPDQAISPYEQTLNDMPRAERVAWASRVRAQMDEAAPVGGRCIVLAGQRYREFLMEYLKERYVVEVPMERLAIGRQLQWLSRHASSAASEP